MDNLKALIINQIKSVFEGVKVYDEPVKQGLKTPAFLVLIVNDSQARKLGNLSEWQFLLNVTYFPKDTLNANSEIDRVSEDFKRNFRYIANQFHVFRLEASKQDNMLIITFSVRKLVREIEVETKMQTLQYGGATSD